MKRSTPPSKTSSGHLSGQAGSVAAGSLPFSIDHILSSSPIKQAAAVQAAVQQQQQAAAMMMMNSQEAVSAAMLNEQLAILNQQHLLNPTALAAAAAANQQHWQHQQQLMAAANLAAVQQHQHQQQALPLLNPLSQLSAAQASNPQLLSCFMAYVLLQQQQQQQQQQNQHQLPLHQHHQLHHLAQDQSAPMSARSHRSQANHHNQLQNSSNGSPLKPLTNKSSVYDSIAALTNCTAPSPAPVARESRQRDARRSMSPSPVQQTSKPMSAIDSSLAKHNKSSSSSSTSSNDHQSSTALSSLSNFVTESLAPILSGDAKATISNKDHKLYKAGNSSFTSSNFLSKSNSIANFSAATKSQQQQQGGRQFAGNNGNISQHRKSSSIEPDEARNSSSNNNNGPAIESKDEMQNRNTLDLISSAAQALKSNGTTINNTLAKAPPDLVRKQPPWVFCTRYSDRPSSGPRTRRAKSKDKKAKDPKLTNDEKRPRTAFTSEQLERLRQEFQDNSYLDEPRRKNLAETLCLNENQIKIWFQNKRAKMKKQNHQPNPLRGLLVAGGLYNHSTATSDCSESYANGNDNDEDDEDDNDFVDNGEMHTSSNKRQRNQQDDDDGNHINFNNNEEETGMMSSTAKRARLNHSGSDSGSESSRVADLDEEERVISVS